MSASPLEEPERIDWVKVDRAVATLESLDVVEMAKHIVTQVRSKGPKEAFNEAGTVRYQLAKARQQVALLQQSICGDDLEKQNELIKALTYANEKKRVLTGQQSDAMED